MDVILQNLLGITLIIFMVGNLLEVGLKLQFGEALVAIRNVEFVFLGLLWAFVLCPALAVLLTRIIPLSEPYAVGLIFLGMAPCAPFLPLVAEKAGGDLASIAAFSLLAYIGTVLFMPIATPLLVPGFEADAWMIAKPLLLYIIAPLVIGILIRSQAEVFAGRAHPLVKKITGVDTLIMLLLVLWIYADEFLNAVGTYAIGGQFLFYLIVAAAAYASAFRLPHPQRSVLALGLCTRNIGAAIAPLLAAPGTDPRALAMVTLAVPLSVLCAFLVSRSLARLSAPGGESVAQSATTGRVHGSWSSKDKQSGLFP